MKGLGLSVASFHWSNLSNVMVKNIERRNTNVLLGFFTSFSFTVQYKKKKEGEVVTGIYWCNMYWCIGNGHISYS